VVTRSRQLFLEQLKTEGRLRAAARWIRVLSRHVAAYWIVLECSIELRLYLEGCFEKLARVYIRERDIDREI